MNTGALAPEVKPKFSPTFIAVPWQGTVPAVPVFDALRIRHDLLLRSARARPRLAALRTGAGNAAGQATHAPASLAAAPVAGRLRTLLPGSRHHPHRAPLDQTLDRQRSAGFVSRAPELPDARLRPRSSQRPRPHRHLDGRSRSRNLPRNPAQLTTIGPNSIQTPLPRVLPRSRAGRWDSSGRPPAT